MYQSINRHFHYILWFPYLFSKGIQLLNLNLYLLVHVAVYKLKFHTNDCSLVHVIGKLRFQHLNVEQIFQIEKQEHFFIQSAVPIYDNNDFFKVHSDVQFSVNKKTVYQSINKTFSGLCSKFEILAMKKVISPFAPFLIVKTFVLFLLIEILILV